MEWPDGRRAGLIFLFEEESDPARFSILRLVRYCTDIAELLDTRRVVPVVIFLRSAVSDYGRRGRQRRITGLRP